MPIHTYILQYLMYFLKAKKYVQKIALNNTKNNFPWKTFEELQCANKNLFISFISPVLSSVEMNLKIFFQLLSTFGVNRNDLFQEDIQ